MTYYYQCSECQKSFDVKEAIDGLEKGFQRGFVCPLCGSNLEEDEHSERFSLKSIVVTEWLSLFAFIFSLYALYNYGAMKFEWVVSFIAFGALLGISKLIKSMGKVEVILKTKQASSKNA